MNLTLQCIPCIINNFLRLTTMRAVPEQTRESAMRKLLAFLAEADLQQSPPALAGELHRIIRQEFGESDPYSEVKKKYNQMALEMYSLLDATVKAADDPFDMALRYAIAGNVIDFGPEQHLDVMDTLNRVVRSPLGIDHSAQLRQDLKSACTVLYIGDNCGEIVFDKLFLKTIAHPNVFFAVREKPVLNDATPDDAKRVGLDQFAHIITTGDDAPGVVWSSTSDEFKHIFERADVVISKGQGNLEGLIDVPRDIYFLLVVKCDVIAERIGVRKGEFVALKKKGVYIK